VSKVDKVLSKKKKLKFGVSTAGIERLQSMLRDLKPVVQPDLSVSEGPGALGEIITAGAETLTSTGQALGVDAVRWAILSAAGIGEDIVAK
jgi:GTP-binding protein